MHLTSDAFSAFPNNMSTCEACTFVTATSVAKSESNVSCAAHVPDSQREQPYMFQEVFMFLLKKFYSSKLFSSVLGAITGSMEKFEVFVAFVVILAVYLYGKFGDEFEIRKKKAVESVPKVTETVEEEEQEEEEAEEETEEDDKQQASKEATATSSQGEEKGKKSEDAGEERKKKTEKTKSTGAARRLQQRRSPSLSMSYFAYKTW